jgi:ketopantoate reductase
VSQQHSSVGRNEGSEQPFAQALREAGFVVDIVEDMPAWLITHAVFVTVIGAAVLCAGGDSRALGRDRHATAAMVAAVGEGFRALQARGIHPVPAPLRTIFTIVPRAIAVPYWRRQLLGPTGVDTIAPHVVASRETEFPALAAAVRRILGPSAPKLEVLLTAAGV